MKNIDLPICCEGKTVLLIFGGSGDLTFRKLIPALYNLHVLGAVKTGFEVIAIGRRDWTTAVYHEFAKTWARKQARVPFDDLNWKDFTARLYYHRMDLGDFEAYGELDRLLADSCPDSRRVFYYAVAPSWFRTITQAVVKAGLNRVGARIILEKPFGDSLDEARELHAELVAAYGEAELFHIDHYLGKEMVQNILWLRFRNAIFRHVWGRHAISDVQINAFEAEGVGSRGGYYDEAGAFRDMVQNHLFQVLSVLALEPPAAETTEALHDEQRRVLEALRPVDPAAIAEHLVMGQYEGYRDEEKVDPDSGTPTYVALRLFIDTPRWHGVPFYIRTGKSLERRDMEIVIRFRTTDAEAPPDLLIIKVQPDEGVFLRFNVKQPGREETLTPVYMDYCQSCHIENYRNTPEAYERLLMSAVNGDQSMFSRWDQIEASWHFANGVLAAWEAGGAELAMYARGTWGPREALRLPAIDGLDWADSDLPDTSLRMFV